MLGANTYNPKSVGSLIEETSIYWFFSINLYNWSLDKIDASV